MSNLQTLVRRILSNGAEVEKIWRPCDMCVRKNQVEEKATFKVTAPHSMTEIYLCDAHTEQLLNMDDDVLERQKGGMAEFGIES